jgi:hypothetical protein
MITIRLTPEQFEKLSRPVNMPRERMGGFQRLIVRIQEGLKLGPDGWTVTLSCEDARRALDYADPKHGPGTYQAQLRAIEAELQRALRAAGGDATQQGLGF